jgi:N-acetylmuramoyl-L-alanine amidase
MADHPVKPGDCFSSVAKENGYFNYLTLYGHGDNAALKGKRKNPNLLVEGDVVKVPAKRQKKVPLDLDKEKKFVVDRKPTKIRLALMDVLDKAMDLTDCKLVVGPLTSTSKPTGAGLLEKEIDPTVKAGTLDLKINVKRKPEPPPKPATAVTPPEKPPHPPEIAAKDFLDEVEKDDGKPVELSIALQIGFLEPHTEVRGALQRLNNLGCKVPHPTAKTAADDPTKTVVKSYQKFKNPAAATPTGAIKDLEAALETAHDKI